MQGSSPIPIIDLSRLTEEETGIARESLRRYGAFRVHISELVEGIRGDLFPEAVRFFNKPTQDKTATAGYSAHHSERVRREIPIPKETLYFSPKITESGDTPPSEEISRSVDNFNQYWIPFKDHHVLPAFFSFAGNTAALSNHQAPAIDRLGINCYWLDKLQDCDDYFNPPHVDGNLLTALFQPPGEEDDLLEIADLDTTNESGSGGIGDTAEFQPVHFQPGEALILAGKQAERILNVRPCVHRVRKPDSLSGGHRLSLGVFCRLQDRAALT